MSKWPKSTWFSLKVEKEGPHGSTVTEEKGYYVLQADRPRALQAIRECQKALRSLDALCNVAEDAAHDAQIANRNAGAE